MTGLANTQVRRASASLHWAKPRGIVAYLEGSTQVVGHSVNLRIGLTQTFPEILPFVQLAAADEGTLARFLAHVEGDQNVCFTATREVALDPRRPVELILKSLEAAVRTLQSSLLSTNNDDILREFANYWTQAIPSQNILPPVRAYFFADERLRELLAWRSEDCGFVGEKGKIVPNKPKRTEELVIMAVADDPKAPEDFHQGERLGFLKPRRSALYLPLQPGSNLLPPKPGAVWDAADLKRVVRSNLSTSDLELLEKILVERSSRRDLLILGVPRPGYSGIGRYALVAVATAREKGTTKQSHFLTQQSNTDSIQLNMQTVRRVDRAFVVRRGGSNVSLNSKNVLLLGVGSLGGHLAVMLASAGIGHLSLVDYDILSLDNAFRHPLGKLYVGREKAKAIALLLKKRFPYLKVKPFVERTTRVLNRRHIELEKFDLIVDATGDSTHHLVLGDYLSALKAYPPLLTTWLEPLGLGGHVATCFSDQSGCPRCLYSDPQMPLTNVASFAAAGQEFIQDAVGCGSYYTPFSDLDSVRTAELTARKAIDILKGKIQGNLLFSWRGDPDAFLGAGYQLSPRFLSVNDKLLGSGLPYSRRDCDNCRDVT